MDTFEDLYDWNQDPDRDIHENESFNDYFFAISKERLEAIIYEVGDDSPSAPPYGAGGIQFSYKCRNEDRCVVTPLHCSLGGSCSLVSFELEDGEYIQCLETVFFHLDGKVQMECKMHTNRNRVIRIGNHKNEDTFNHREYRAKEGQEIVAFRGEYDEKNTLNIVRSLEKRRDEVHFNDTCLVQTNGMPQKIHVYESENPSRITGIKLEYAERVGEAENPMHGKKGEKHEIIDLHSIYEENERLKGIHIDYAETDSGARYIGVLKFITQRREITVGKRDKNVSYKVKKLMTTKSIRQKREFYIFALSGSCRKDNGELASLDIGMCISSDARLRSVSFEARSFTNDGDEYNEFEAAKKAHRYTVDELTSKFDHTKRDADKDTAEQLEALRDPIVNHKVTDYILRQKHLVFRNAKIWELDYFLNRRTYSKVQRDDDKRIKEGKPIREHKPRIDPEKQNTTHRDYATILRIAALQTSYQPQSQFSSNAFRLFDYMIKYAESDTAYAYEVVPNSEILGMESKEIQCQILGGSRIYSLYRIKHIYDKPEWERYDFEYKDWYPIGNPPCDKQFGKCPEVKEPEHGFDLAKDGEDSGDIFAMRYNWDNVFECRKETEPKDGMEFTVCKFDIPYCVWRLSKEEIKNAYFRLKALDDQGRVGLYMCSDCIEEMAASGFIYALGEHGFLLEDESTGTCYFFPNYMTVKEMQEKRISYIPQTEKASMEQIMNYRFTEYKYDMTQLIYEPGDVFSCERTPAYPQKGESLRVHDFKSPRRLAQCMSLTSDEFEKCRLRLQIENDGRVGLYICKDEDDLFGRQAAVGDIYGLGDEGFLFVDSELQAYFFPVEAVEQRGGDEKSISYIARTGKASVSEIRDYRLGRVR